MVKLPETLPSWGIVDGVAGMHRPGYRTRRASKFTSGTSCFWIVDLTI